MFDGKRVISSISFNWNDAIGSLKEEYIRIFRSFPDSIKAEIVSSKEDEINVSFESNILSNWSSDLRNAVEESDIFDVLVDKKVIVSDPAEGDNWAKSFKGSIYDIKNDLISVEDENGEIFIVDIDKITFVTEEEDTTSKEMLESSTLSHIPQKRIAVLVSAEYMRHSQAATSRNDVEPEADIYSKNWKDFSGAGLIGIFTSESKDSAIKEVALKLGIEEGILEAYELASEDNEISVSTPQGRISASIVKEDIYPGIWVKVDEDGAALVEYDSSVRKVMVRTYKKNVDEQSYTAPWNTEVDCIMKEYRITYLKNGIGEDIQGKGTVPAEVSDWYAKLSLSDKPLYSEFLVKLNDQYGLLNIFEFYHPESDDEEDSYDVTSFSEVVAIENELKPMLHSDTGFIIFSGNKSGILRRHELYIFTPYETEKETYVQNVDTACKFIAESLKIKKDIDIALNAITFDSKP